jgi:hypothetical protein
MDRKHRNLAATAALVLAATLGISPVASAKKMSYEQAWKSCKAELDREKIPSTTTSNARYLRGGACMKRHGYNL